MKIIDKGTVRLADWKREAPAPGQIIRRLVPDGNTDVTYVIELADVRRLVERASRNRNGMAVDGPLRVRILKRDKVTE
jgi:hypothetical protein